MADLARLFNFVGGTPAVADEVDAELSQLVAGHNAQEDSLEVLGSYRTLLAACALGATGVPATAIPDGQGGLKAPGSSPPATFGGALYLDDGDFAVTGKVAKLRLRAQLWTEGAPGVTITAGLYPVTAMDTVGLLTLGAVVAGSTVAFAAPAATSLLSGSSGDFAFPGDGHYVLGVARSGAPADGFKLSWQLQLRHV